MRQDEELIEAYNRGQANAEDQVIERQIDAAIASGELPGVSPRCPTEVNLSSISVSTLPLKVRSYNILRREGVLSVGDLVGRTEAEIYEFQSAGESVVLDIRDSLADLGLALKPGTPKPVVVEQADIVSYRVHEHRPSGLILKVHGDGRVEQPVIKAHQMSILTQLLAAAADL